MGTFPIVANNASQSVILRQRYANSERPLFASFRRSDEVMLMMVVQLLSSILIASVQREYSESSLLRVSFVGRDLPHLLGQPSLADAG